MRKRDSNMMRPARRLGRSLGWPARVVVVGLVCCAVGACGSDGPARSSGQPFEWSLLHPATSPSPRDSYVSAFDTATNQLLLFGGEAPGFDGPGTELGDTWLWAGETWRLLHPKTSPPPLVAAVMLMTGPPDS